MKSPKLLLIGLDSVDSALVRRWAGEGHLPTMARLLAQVYKPTSGQILYQGRSLADLHGRAQRLAYRSDVPMVFQDPFSSLNPAYRVSHGILRGLRLHRPDLNRDQRRAEAERVVTAVGLNPAGEILRNRACSCSLRMSRAPQ